jgi:hypothetical protein
MPGMPIIDADLRLGEPAGLGWLDGDAVPDLPCGLDRPGRPA